MATTRGRQEHVQRSERRQEGASRTELLDDSPSTYDVIDVAPDAPLVQRRELGAAMAGLHLAIAQANRGIYGDAARAPVQRRRAKAQMKRRGPGARPPTPTPTAAPAPVLKLVWRPKSAVQAPRAGPRPNPNARTPSAPEPEVTSSWESSLETTLAPIPVPPLGLVVPRIKVAGAVTATREAKGTKAAVKLTRQGGEVSDGQVTAKADSGGAGLEREAKLEGEGGFASLKIGLDAASVAKGPSGLKPTFSVGGKPASHVTWSIEASERGVSIKFKISPEAVRPGYKVVGTITGEIALEVMPTPDLQHITTAQAASMVQQAAIAGIVVLGVGALVYLSGGAALPLLLAL